MTKQEYEQRLEYLHFVIHQETITIGQCKKVIGHAEESIRNTAQKILELVQQYEIQGVVQEAERIVSQ